MDAARLTCRQGLPGSRARHGRPTVNRDLRDVEAGPAHSSSVRTAGLYVGVPSVYVGVPSVEAALATASSLGGTRLMGPEPAAGTFAVGHFADPEGNVTGVAGATLTETAGAGPARRPRCQPASTQGNPPCTRKVRATARGAPDAPRRPLMQRLEGSQWRVQAAASAAVAAGARTGTDAMGARNWFFS
jgi:hypothetical protein